LDNASASAVQMLQLQFMRLLQLLLQKLEFGHATQGSK